MSKLDYFLRDRNEALLSLDKERIMAYCRRWGVKMVDPAKDEQMFWMAVHKARTALTALPIEERLASKKWLQDRGYHSLDDGDLG